MTIFDATLDLYLDAAPWLLLGLVAAGLVKAWVSEAGLGRLLGGEGVGPVLRAAFIGAPLPLCSCGVLPAAIGLRRGGASKGATVSFLVATPETGPDSIAVSYVLLGPFMMVVRPVAAVFSAVLAGLLAGLGKSVPMQPQPEKAGRCCSSSSCGSEEKVDGPPGLLGGLRFAFTDVYRDMAPWMAGGLVVTGIVTALLPPGTLAEWGSGPWAMLAMLLVGMPLYVCATASTPIAAGLLAVGVSPGAVLVFLLVGPATNLATLGMVGRELGSGAVAGYLAGIAIGALGMGFLADTLVAWGGFDVSAQIVEASGVLPHWAEVAGGILLLAPLAPAVARRAGHMMTQGHSWKN